MSPSVEPQPLSPIAAAPSPSPMPNAFLRLHLPMGVPTRARGCVVVKSWRREDLMCQQCGYMTFSRGVSVNGAEDDQEGAMLHRSSNKARSMPAKGARGRRVGIGVAASLTPLRPGVGDSVALAARPPAEAAG